MNAIITCLATAAGFVAVFLAGDYQNTGNSQILVLGAMEGAAMIGGLAHLLRYGWVE